MSSAFRPVTPFLHCVTDTWFVNFAEFASRKSTKQQRQNKRTSKSLSSSACFWRMSLCAWSARLTTSCRWTSSRSSASILPSLASRCLAPAVPRPNRAPRRQRPDEMRRDTSKARDHAPRRGLTHLTSARLSFPASSSSTPSSASPLPLPFLPPLPPFWSGACNPGA